MLKNYIKIAWRNLTKRKFYSMITIFGLSVGITFSLIIGSYVWGEIQVNNTLKNADNQYQIQSKWKKADMGMDKATLAPLAKALKENYPNLIQNYYRFDAVTSVFSIGDKAFREEIQLGDSTILKMYGFHLLYGDVRTALNQPYNMVISSEQAHKYFGKLDVVGQTLNVESFLGEKKDFMISGVLDKIPLNSITGMFGSKMPVLMSFACGNFMGRGDFDDWTNPYMVSFVELKNGVKKEDLAKPLAQLIGSNATREISDNLQTYLVPIKQVYQEANNGLVRKTVLTLSFIALFVLILAIVNFVNIAIGNSTYRLKEIGVRKVLGGVKGQIIRQLLIESIIIALFSLLLSLVFYEFFRPNFSGLFQKELISLWDASPNFYLSALLLSLFIGLLAGIYPAFILATLPSVDSMKGKLKTVKENIFLRRLLIISQFTAALFVFGAAVFISQQLAFFFNKNLGYHKEAIISVRTPRDWSPNGVEKMKTIRNGMAQIKEVNHASLSYEVPDGNIGFNNGIYKLGQDSTKAIFLPTLTTDEYYAETYQIPMVAGQFFHKNIQSVVLNETAIKALGFKDAAMAIGQQVKFQNIPKTYTIVGVTKDFHFESLHNKIRPMAFMQVSDNNFYRYISFKIPSGNVKESVQAIQNKWKQFLPDFPFEYNFMDDTLQQLYQSEIQLKKATQIAAILAFIIVLLGILGMVSLSISKRIKEVSIRKIFGASELSIAMLFLKEFVVVMAISIAISFPLIFIGVKKWLQNFAYRIELSWLSFVWIGIAFVGIVIVIVSVQIFNASIMNPVKSLKTE